MNIMVKRRCRGWVPARFSLSAGAYPRESSFYLGNTFIKIEIAEMSQREKGVTHSAVIGVILETEAK